jgi:hypothetical protein
MIDYIIEEQSSRTRYRKLSLVVYKGSIDREEVEAAFSPPS